MRAAVASLACALLGALALWIAVIAVDFPAEWLAPARVESRRLLDRHGGLLREALSDAEGRGVWRPLAQISPWVPRAFIAIEDRRFESHPGVDLRGIARAARDNLRAGRVVAGGSTITQQVVQLVHPEPRTVVGKLFEAVWALRLERAVDKAGILEQYVNRAPFGHGAFGIEAAARQYLDKPAAALSLAEAALLAGLPRAPSVTNPFTDPEAARRRQVEVLHQMRTVGFIDDAALADALAEPTRLAARDARFVAPHFTSWALAQDATPGAVPTTLDPMLQAEAERIVRQTVRELHDRAVSQAAAIVLDTPTGDVLAWVGSVDFFAPRDGQVDMVISRRQPGSTLKPFVYGLGIEDGFTAATRLPDLPLFFPTAFGDYRPRNYDRTYHGFVTLRTALANSYNVPAVWMANRVGPARLLARLRALGFASLRRGADHYGLGLALGNGEVQLLELANAYRALANEGEWAPIRWRRDTPVATGQRVMPVAVARLVTDLIADPIARVPAFGRANPLDLPFPAAAKTGTSTDFTDNWTVGYTPAVTVAVWVGNFDGRPMEGVSGITGAGRLWHRLMRLAAGEGRPREFRTAGLERVRLCEATGARFSEDCAHPVEEWFLPGTAPGPTGAPARPAALRVRLPGPGGVFQRDADTPAVHARLLMQADAPAEVQSLAFEVDGAPIGTSARPFQLWWSLAPGRHRVRVRPVEGGAPSAEVSFEVLD
ncbi:MAG: penicillin-binding protein 1C [Myxococcales bacterium]|nr:penicillin-binding protein 1C [Myxococcales bacterium]